MTGQRPALTGPRSALTGPRPAVTGQRPALTGPRSALTGPRPAVTGQRPALTGPRSALTEISCWEDNFNIFLTVFHQTKKKNDKVDGRVHVDNSVSSLIKLNFLV
ncbi:hypothetical protein OTU49_009337 [Cherax quadricarinatus]|uniref:Uncharacterized protein n=1 Tax=Cherax quadricarinatus TaxID=27406 RepID=A0AAW0WAI6_CHEQU